jgi:ubiquinone/menaquinone biosynthesis C-methylase UbiE
MVHDRLVFNLQRQLRSLEWKQCRLKKQQDPPGKQQDSKGHYGSEVAAGYEGAFFYKDGSDYNKWYLEKVQEELKLTPETTFTDVGGGTGNFTAALAKKSGMKNKPLNAEPYLEMLEQSPASVDTMHIDASVFAKDASMMKVDRIMMKEVIHHVETAHLQAIFAGMRKKLNSGGRLLVITRPSKGIEYPFFDAAFQVWQDNQLESSVYENCLRDAGFAVTSKIVPYPCEIDKRRWIKMVESRFWSTFSHFSNDELSAGILELQQKYAGTETLTFNDNLIFITALAP